MNTLNQFILDNPTLSDAQIATAFNADTSRYKSVASNAVLEWMGVGGRYAKIEGWIDGAATNTDPNVIALRAALRVLLLAASNPSSYLSLEPGSTQRDLLTYAVGASVITQDDADALLAKAKIGEDVTEADVTTARAANARRAAGEALLVKLATYEGNIRTAVNAYIAGTAGTLPEVPNS